MRRNREARLYKAKAFTIHQLLDHPRVSEDDSTNLRVDYVLPSRDLKVVDSGVFWPAPGEPGAEAVKATDHRMVWVEIVP